MDAIDKELATGKVESERQWYLINTNQHSMTLFPGPVEFTMGSPETESDRRNVEALHRSSINRNFAIATKEVTVAQFRRFVEDAGISFSIIEKYAPEDYCPQTSVNW